MTTNYARGYALEQRVATALRADGYWTATSRGSKGAADVIALKWRTIVLVQVKRDGRIGPLERAKLHELAVRVGGEAVVAYMPGPRGIAYRRLTGPGPKDWTPWTPDQMEN